MFSKHSFLSYFNEFHSMSYVLNWICLLCPCTTEEGCRIAAEMFIYTHMHTHHTHTNLCDRHIKQPLSPVVKLCMLLKLFHHPPHFVGYLSLQPYPGQYDPRNQPHRSEGVGGEGREIQGKGYRKGRRRGGKEEEEWKEREEGRRRRDGGGI